MRERVQAVRKRTWLAPLLIIAATVLYLGLTAAFAQNSVTSDNSGTKLAYDPDYLSYGDMYAFTESVYSASSYGLQNATQTVSLYNSKDADTSSSTSWPFYNYYGSVTTGNHSNVRNGVKMENHTYAQFHTGYTQSTAPAAVEGEAVPVLTTSGTGVYTLVPGSTGTYRIYAYGTQNPSGHVYYDLIDSYTKANAYTGTPSQALTFTQVPGTNYWYAEINVDVLSWSAYQISAAKSGDTASEPKDDTNGNVTYTGSQGTNTTLNPHNYYYNVWTATEIFYDTLLAIRWDSSVQLAPVTKLGDTITIRNTDSTMGTLTAVNAFGETVAVDSAVATVHAPIYITATPASAEYVFSGFGDAELSLVDAAQGIYRYGFETTAALSGSWTDREDLPTIQISGAYSGTMDFFAATSVSTQIVSGTLNQYTLTADFSSAGDTQTVSYTVASGGETTQSGSLTAENNTVQFSAQWNAVTVTITAVSTSGASYSATFTVNISTAGLVDVAQIGSATYQYIEDALAAATSGQTITIITPTVSFVSSDVVPASWTADSNGDGSPDGYTVKEGVTLILPYSITGSTSLESASSEYPYALYNLSSVNTNSLATSTSYEYRKLTVPSGKTMYVKGTVATGGTISSIAGVSGGTNGSTSETYSVLEVNGEVEVQSGGILTSCGYVYGSGTLSAMSGAALYQPMVIMDFRGGGYTVGAAGSFYAIDTRTGEDYVSPFIRYATQNIQSNVQMEEGALMYGYCDLYTQSTGGHNRTTGVLVGSSSLNVDGLIKLETGATLTSTYDSSDTVSPYPRVGHLDVTVEGGGSFGILELTAMGQTIETSDLTFPVPYNYSFHLNGNNATYNIGYSMALLPGATLEVGAGATLNVGSNSSNFRFIVYDGLYDHTNNGSSSGNVTVNYGTQPSNNYPTTANLQAAGKTGTADLVVNGTLNINSGVNFGGVVQAGSASARVVMSSSATPSCTAQTGLVGDGRILVNRYYFAGATTRTLTAQVMDRGTGERLDIQPGLTYYGFEGGSVLEEYTYNLYTSSSNAGSYVTRTEALNAAIQGSWYNYTALLHTVGADGAILSTSTVYFCHGADASGYFLDPDCTQPAGTVKQDNMVLYQGADTAVARVDWASGAPSTYYPSLRSAVQEATGSGDQVFLLRDITLNQPVGIASSQNVTINLGEWDITYSATPFVNSGTVTIIMGAGGVLHSSTAVPALSNQAGGSMTVRLGGGSIQMTLPESAVSTPTMVINNGTMVLDLGGGSIVCDYPAILTAASQAITNMGDLTLRSTGSQGRVSINTGREATYINSSGNNTNYALFTISATPAESLAAVVRNAGSGSVLTVENVSLTQGSDMELNASNTNTPTSVGIMNFNGAEIRSLTDVAVSAENGYAMYNLGATVGSISGGSYSGYYGIYNRNIRSGSNSGGNRFAIHRQADIDAIDGVSVSATSQYAIFNGGVIGSIGGNGQFTAPTNTIYNHNGWYYDSNTVSYSDSSMVRTYLYDTENLPTIGSIGGTVSVTATGNYALRNYGSIGSIDGSASFTANNYAIEITTGGQVDRLAGNVTVRTNASYAITVTGQSTERLVRTYAGTSANPSAIGGNTLEEVYTYGNPSTLGAVTGDMSGSGVTITAGSSNALHVTGVVGDITGRVSLNAASYGLSISTEGASSSRHYVRTYADPHIASTETERSDTYVRNMDAAHVGNVGGANSNVTITVTTQLGVSVGGYLESLGENVVVRATTGTTWNSVVYVSEGRQTGKTNRQILGGTTDSGLYITRYERTYTHDAADYPATIGSIDGAEITTPKLYALRNSGLIQSLRNSTITARQYAVHNYSSGPYDGTRETIQYYASSSLLGTSSSILGETALSYARGAARLDTVENCTITATGSSYGLLNGGTVGSITGTTITTATERALSNTENQIVIYRITVPEGEDWVNLNAAAGTCTMNTGRTVTYDYTAPTITEIGGGNTFTSTTNTLFNSGVMTTVGGGEGETLTSVTATSGVALYNYRGTLDARTTPYTGGAAGSNQDTYLSARIGTVQNIQLSGTTYGLRNGDGNGTYPGLTIDELADGVIATASASDGYGVYVSGNSSIALISGGHYKGAGETGNRAYAINSPDSQTYPDGMGLSAQGITESVTLADGSTASLYYFITNGQLVAQIIAGDSETWYPSLAAAVAAYTSPEDPSSPDRAYICMVEDSTESGFTIDKDVYLDLNGKTVTVADGAITIADGRTLYGMDSTTDDYTAPTAGSISVTTSGTGEVAPVYQTPIPQDGSYLRYVAVWDEGNTAVSFHRFNISVTGYRFEMTTSPAECALFFIGSFRGDSTVRAYLQSLGITIEADGTTHSGSVDAADAVSDGYVEVDEEQNEYLFEAFLRRVIDGSDPTTYREQLKAFATVTFLNEGSFQSETRTVSFQEAWENAAIQDPQQAARLKEFLEGLSVAEEPTIG